MWISGGILPTSWSRLEIITAKLFPVLQMLLYLLLTTILCEKNIHLSYKLGMLSAREVLQILQMSRCKTRSPFQLLKLQSVYVFHEQIDLSKLSAGHSEYIVNTFSVIEELGWISVWCVQKNACLTQDNLRQQLDSGTTNMLTKELLSFKNYSEGCVLSHTLSHCETVRSHKALCLLWLINLFIHNHLLAH